MKVLFTVFSASGNTARVCRLFSERLKERGAECETVRIREDMKTPDYAAADVLVIGYPVHGFNAPQNVVDFAKGLPECENKVYYIIKTSGEPLHINDASSRILDRALKKKGYVKKGEFHYVMPYNMIFRHSDDMAALMWQAAGNTAPQALQGEEGQVRLLRQVRKALPDGQHRDEGRAARLRQKLHRVHGVFLQLSRGRHLHRRAQRVEGERGIQVRAAPRRAHEKGRLCLLERVVRALFPRARHRPEMKEWI